MVVVFEKETPVRFEPTSTFRAQNKEPFGLYRPFTPESADLIAGILLDAQEEVESFLRNHRGIKTSDIIPNEEFGTTFLGRKIVNNALALPKFNKIFDIDSAVSGINRYIENSALEAPIPVGEIDWGGMNYRKLSFAIAPNQVLKQDAAIMQFWLNKADGKQLRVRPPNHATLLRYGHQSEGTGLRHWQREKAAKIVTRHFKRQRVSEVMLAKPVLGDGYLLPWLSGMQYSEAA